MARTSLKQVKEKIQDSKASQRSEEESLDLKRILPTPSKKKTWEYGYDSEHDIVVISKDGTLGEVYQIQNLKIGLPSVHNNVHKRSSNKKEQYWEHQEYPKELSRIKNIFEWNDMPNAFKNEWVDYIEDEFTKRDEGFWFYNN